MKMTKLFAVSFFSIVLGLGICGCGLQQENAKVTEAGRKECSGMILNMEQYQDYVVEMPPEGIEDMKEGVLYPEFTKYTYYSTTAERNTNVNILLPPNYTEEKEYPPA